jgi:two-component system cell cycle response regulator
MRLLLSRPEGPRLAIVDWMMPKLDGLALCRELRTRKDRSYVYVLLLTANQLNGDIVTGLQAGADDYLTKPCQPAELKARLHTGRRILELEDKLVEAREAMRFKATHDPLTSLWDRGAILSLAQAALRRSDQEGFPVSLLLCDIDHFKKINDVYGHQAGDEVLRETSTRLLGAIRSTDSVGRYGGEEFLVVLSGCARSGLKFVGEQMRKAIGSAPFSTTHGPISVSLSAGAITVERWDGSMPIEKLLNEADAALYRAKRAGRDRVAYAESPCCPTVACA